MSPNLEWALKYLKHGWSVIPIGAEKKPLVEWKKYQTERATEEQLKNWFDVANPPNIGVVTGKISNLTVVDVEKGGNWADLPVTMTAKTGGGGYHLFYKYAQGVANSVRIRPLTDIRGDGGYVVVTPSLHKSGHKYEWTRKEDEQPFPFQFFKLQPKENNDWKKILDGVGNGERNQSATKAIGKILNAVNPKDWSTTAWEMFVIWNQRNNPPLGERELRSVFNSIVGIAVRKGQAKNVETNEDDCDIKLISDIAKNLTDDMTVSYPTGFKKFDEAFMGGLKEGDLMFVTGYSGMGKTLYAQSMTYNLVKNGQPCLWFSFEVSLGELWRKFKDMGVDDNFSAYSPEKTTIRKLDWVHEKIIDSRDRFKTKVIFVDHLGFLSEEPKNYDGNLSSNYATILTMVCRRLKTIAIAENVAVVLLGHLRKPTNGASNDPTFHDIKDSSGVAQESDAVIIINRERTSKGYENEEVYSATTTVKIEKNRRTGTTKKFSVKIDQGRLRDEDEVIFKDFTNLKLPQ